MTGNEGLFTACGNTYAHVQNKKRDAGCGRWAAPQRSFEKHADGCMHGNVSSVGVSACGGFASAGSSLSWELDVGKL